MLGVRCALLPLLLLPGSASMKVCTSSTAKGWACEGERQVPCGQVVAHTSLSHTAGLASQGCGLVLISGAQGKY